MMMNIFVTSERSSYLLILLYPYPLLFRTANDISRNTGKPMCFTESYVVVLYLLLVYPEFSAASDRSCSPRYGSFQQGHSVMMLLI